MFKIKKIIAGAASAVLAVGMLSTSAFAYSNTGTVKVNTSLNVRAAASTGSSVIGRLYNGAKVSITGGSYGWYKISYNGKTAWVSGDYITLPQSNASRISTVTGTASNMLGTKYVFGGASVSGFDCSGLTLYAFEKAGVFLPHRAVDQAKLGTFVSRSALKPGDLIFFDTTGKGGTINHVGIYIGNNNFISAQSGLGKVNTQSLTTGYWSNAYMTARRYIG